MRIGRMPAANPKRKRGLIKVKLIAHDSVRA
jgi:hypothetical protein